MPSASQLVSAARACLGITQRAVPPPSGACVLTRVGLGAQILNKGASWKFQDCSQPGWWN